MAGITLDQLGLHYRKEAWGVVHVRHRGEGVVNVRHIGEGMVHVRCQGKGVDCVQRQGRSVAHVRRKCEGGFPSGTELRVQIGHRAEGVVHTRHDSNVVVHIRR